MSDLIEEAQQVAKCQIVELQTEFIEVGRRLIKGEGYLDEHPEDQAAFDLFKKLLDRMAEINLELMKLGEEPMGRMLVEEEMKHDS